MSKKTKKYFFEGTEYELREFTYKHQMTFDDCVGQYVSTLLSNISRVRNKASRKQGLPDEFGEGIVRYHYPDFVSFKSTTGKKGDMYDENQTVLAEVKTATSNGPTSFGPVSNSQIYFFCDVDMPTAEYKLYEIPHSLIGTAVIDKDTTLAQQWTINKSLLANKQRAPRPRFSMRHFVKKNSLIPKFQGVLIDKSKSTIILERYKTFWEEIEKIIKQ